MSTGTKHYKAADVLSNGPSVVTVTDTATGVDIFLNGGNNNLNLGNYVFDTGVTYYISARWVKSSGSSPGGFINNVAADFSAVKYFDGTGSWVSVANTTGTGGNGMNLADNFTVGNWAGTFSDICVCTVPGACELPTLDTQGNFLGFM